jgi:hypothetical protein
MNVVARPRPTGAGQVPGLCHQVVAGVPLVIHCIPCAASTGQRSRPIDSRRTGVTVVDVASGNHDVAAAQFDDGAVGDGHRNAAVPVVGAWAGSVTAPPPWCPPSPRRLMGSPESALLKAASRPRTDTRSERHCAFAGSRPTSRTPDVQARLHERRAKAPMCAHCGTRATVVAAIGKNESRRSLGGRFRNCRVSAPAVRRLRQDQCVPRSPCCATVSCASQRGCYLSDDHARNILGMCRECSDSPFSRPRGQMGGLKNSSSCHGRATPPGGNLNGTPPPAAAQ